MKLLLGCLLVGMIVVSSGCVAMSKYQELETKYAQLTEVQKKLEERNRQLENTVSSLEGELRVANAKVNLLEAHLQAAKEFGSVGEELKTLLKSLAEGDSGVELIEGGLVLQGDVFFDSGKADLKEESKKILDKIAEILKKEDVMLSIQGHTDSDPIKYSGWKTMTNWELSAYRALNVAVYLSKQGIKAEKIHIVGWGEYKPRAPNDTKENKQKNRRVEIYIIQKGE